MRTFRNLPIKHKLIGIMMLTSLVVLLLACLSFSVTEQVSFRNKVTQEFTTLADVLDDTLSAGLAFTDTESMDNILKSLIAHRHVRAAAVYDKAGQRVSKYERDAATGGYPWPVVGPEGTFMHSDRLDTVKDIRLAGEQIGTLYIATDLDQIQELRSRSLQIGGGVLVVTILVAYWLASRLQGVISGPISDLAQTATRFVAENDYSLRATKRGDDELGSLVDRFNQMLAQIESQQLALLDANTQLETRVANRTSELTMANAKLAASHRELRLLEAAMQASVNAIVITDSNACIRWINPAFTTLTGYDADETVGLNTQMLNYGQQHDPYFEQLKKTIQTGKPWQGELSNRRKDGSPYYEELTITPVIDPAGGETHFIAVKQDITARKRAEADLLEVRQELLTTSRQAGMAEVATSVLHNVGNVLNSVSVSAEVVTGKVRQPKAANLQRVADLLREHTHDLPEFLTTDPRGRELPGYLVKLAEHLAKPPADILEELAALRKNIEHIKEIVAMQQNFARCSGVVESLSAGELLEDAVRMNAGGLGRHEVQLVREFADVPVIETDRHKVMQILVNLLTNAKHAVASVAGEKRITMRVNMNGSGRVKVEVIDNGMGIAPENLKRIFQHGFTTKQEGHGFGLHSAANSAKELGGCLSAHSDGPGRGAHFTLELPLHPPKD